ncbi:Rne/Rng family ribonuclease [Notoacmeibacter sp. MSK16QG-6]|uniref:Rne/Rng family ribonuclease n=1 Tax=Notoacmeibacter sp. MSK16QG-6 TaxID=2957982 RepID=UPI0020A0380F|nr:Rne/Rng family ribonuclease [Notoacmeibacter sp. MSK16QG-6]MCP1197846.1 Rne/Rng family ribonuclease [Notoacmeibacter sp. MSK16QG-6]
MSNNKMLIDASHPEETRVVVCRGNRIEEFDFESQHKKQLKGNIYLARVTRVEPSLQAAFVEYGGNRHGFLAFSEIHPDYYQIPLADRQALAAAEAEEALRESLEEDEEQEENNRSRRRRRSSRGRKKSDDTKGSNKSAKGDDAEASEETATADTSSEKEPDDLPAAEEIVASDTGSEEKSSTAATDAGADGSKEADSVETPENDEPPSIAMAVDSDVISEKLDESSDEDETGSDDGDDSTDEDYDEDEEVENLGSDDPVEETRHKRAPRKNYKIQEVIKRRQILLVQVVKEERGNKGAALTTYLSLAGRYSVLMPNTARGGGISRKITQASDRKRLKEIVKDLHVPQGMGVILRTAGANRSKPEIKRDYEYLMRLWDNVRSLTLESTAPALVYEEGSLIKRSVRDLYNKDISEILVSGDEGYREAKDFMRMLTPSHAKAVQRYRDPQPLFARHGVESQLDKMLQPQVTLKSGGYLIINQTEALVAIDVNSGRSTREHSIEDTALATNLEAAEEVARQLRLRDLAGLIVIDFIDMDEKRNNRSVEKKLKDCLKDDRARIQVGRISPFGLLEMSRQRIRASVLESTMHPCDHCHGTGYIRSDSSTALHVIRSIEDHLTRDSRFNITVRTASLIALYVLNNKRAMLIELEQRFGVAISVEADETLGAKILDIQRGEAAAAEENADRLPPSTGRTALVEDDAAEDEKDAAAIAAAEESSDDESDSDDGNNGRRKRRRRRRRGGAKDNEDSRDQNSSTDSDDNSESDDDKDSATDDDDGDDQKGSGRRRRRGRRGGRRNRDRSKSSDNQNDADPSPENESGSDSDNSAGEKDHAIAAEAVDTPKATGAVEGDNKSDEAATTDTSAKTLPEPAAAEPTTASIDEDADAQSATASSGGSEHSAEAGNGTLGDTVQSDAVQAEEASKPKSRTRRTKTASNDDAPAEVKITTVSPDGEEAAEPEKKPRRSGWWNRGGFF